MQPSYIDQNYNRSESQIKERGADGGSDGVNSRAQSGPSLSWITWTP